MELKEKNYFEELYNVNVNDYVEKKEDGNTSLSYLSWSFAWAEILKRYPNAQYRVERFNDGCYDKPYLYDEDLGYMVFTRVSIDGNEKEMWLPVMDGKNKAMKNHQYKYTTKYGEKTVEPATMFDINKTIQRCLVKNLAMFGLGLYIYAGEDLPEDEKKEIENTDYKDLLMKYIEENKLDKTEICKTYKLSSKSTNIDFKNALDKLKEAK